ncbi:MAG: phage minor capsid protein [Clostridia bacterium]|nr:phage minor capsid protein [Clostridia bacterium]
MLYNYSGTPREYSIEAATKMNILTGINLAASQQTLENAAALGCDLVETSAHIGARDIERPGKPWSSHAAWQGRVFCLNGERDYIDGDGNKQHAPNFAESCGLGEADGICGINCRHSYYPYFEGTPQMYSKGELDEMKDKLVKLDGKDITPYEAEQELRLCERNIREYKAQAAALEMTDNTQNPKYTRARENIYKWQEKARHIVDETGIKRKYINEYIGTRDGVQPRGIKPINNKALKEFEKSTIQSVAQDLANRNVEALKVEKLSSPITSDAIIKKLSGGDLTGGSCSSLAFAYAGNLGGFDVTDYRGGASRRVFATTSNIVEIANLKGVKSEVLSATNDVRAALDLLKNIEKNYKEYYLATGRHAAIVRKTNNGFEFLEMQASDPKENIFKTLDESALKRRFKCRVKGVYNDESILIECESLAKNKDFRKLLKYINTNTYLQQKGIKGTIK